MQKPPGLHLTIPTKKERTASFLLVIPLPSFSAISSTSLCHLWVPPRLDTLGFYLHQFTPIWLPLTILDSTFTSIYIYIYPYTVHHHISRQISECPHSSAPTMALSPPRAAAPPAPSKPWCWPPAVAPGGRRSARQRRWSSMGSPWADTALVLKAAILGWNNYNGSGDIYIYMCVCVSIDRGRERAREREGERERERDRERERLYIRIGICYPVVHISTYLQCPSV